MPKTECPYCHQQVAVVKGDDGIRRYDPKHNKPNGSYCPGAGLVIEADRNKTRSFPPGHPSARR